MPGTEFIYADYAATTPLRPEVREYLHAIDDKIWGNPSSIHSLGRAARNLIEESREKVAALIGADPEEIIFTSGGTEANNLALSSFFNATERKSNGLLITPIEHPSLRKKSLDLQKRGIPIDFLKIDHTGLIDLNDFDKRLTGNFRGLVSIFWGNNEVGTLNPIEEIGKSLSEKIYLHTDAVQVVGKIPVDVQRSRVDMLTLSAHKIYGPKGIGALYVNKRVPFSPIFLGGHQENNRRAGTENLLGIAGFARAAELIMEEQAEYRNHLSRLGGLLRKGLSGIPGVKLIGHPISHLPGFAAFICENLDSKLIVMNLDLMDIAVSSGSACASGANEKSYVLEALGYESDRYKSVVRISLGKYSSKDEVLKICKAVKEIVLQAR